MTAYQRRGMQVAALKDKTRAERAAEALVAKPRTIHSWWDATLAIEWLLAESREVCRQYISEVVEMRGQLEMMETRAEHFRSALRSTVGSALK